MNYLNDEILNLAARLGKQGAIDKKVERKIKSDLMQSQSNWLEEWLPSQKLAPGDGSVKPEQIKSYKAAFSHALNVLSLRFNCFLGLVDEQVLSEDWVLKINVNVLTFTLKDASSPLLKE